MQPIPNRGRTFSLDENGMGCLWHEEGFFHHVREQTQSTESIQNKISFPIYGSLFLDRVVDLDGFHIVPRLALHSMNLAFTQNNQPDMLWRLDDDREMIDNCV
uniref:Uncharacterized protein n=1 Tax=Entomoneis paludosa TaxID=265537 RepID=A0A6U3BSX8_9STRA